MPDGTVDIHIDSTFFTTVSGTDFSAVLAAGNIDAYFTAGQADSIGQRDIAVDYFTTATISATVDALADIFISNSGTLSSNYINTTTQYEVEATRSGLEVALIDYAVPATISGLTRTEDFDLAYFTGSTKISGSIAARLNFIGGRLYNSSDNILGSYRALEDEITQDDYEADYTAGGDYTPLIPGPPEDQVIVSGTDDFTHYFTMGNNTNSGTFNEDCEVYFAGYPMEFNPSKYTYKFHLIAGEANSDRQAAKWDAVVISGSVLDMPFDVYSTAVVTRYYNFDSVCGLVDSTSYSFETEVVSGTISYYYGQALCGVSGTNGYGFDVDILSLKISNFSLDVSEYTAASGTICVDITDDVHNVVTSGSYFIIDETVTSGNIYTPITDGYTMCFDSPTDFDNLVGATTVTVHTENDNGDALEQDFYLTSGYIVEYDNRDQDYGFGSQVVVRGSAENMASCPNTGVDAYFFTTTPKEAINLGASIVGRPWSEKNLSAEITPTTDTIYFYGKTFRIEVRARDFAGNVMEPFTFEFKIEDKP